MRAVVGLKCKLRKMVKWTLAVACGCALLLCYYFLAHVFMVSFENDIEYTHVRYSLDSDALYVAFYPARMLDRRIRPHLYYQFPPSDLPSYDKTRDSDGIVILSAHLPGDFAVALTRDMARVSGWNGKTNKSK